MGIIVGKRSESVELFLASRVPKAQFDVDIVDEDVCWTLAGDCARKSIGQHLTVHVILWVKSAAVLETYGGVELTKHSRLAGSSCCGE